MTEHNKNMEGTTWNTTTGIYCQEGFCSGEIDKIAKAVCSMQSELEHSKKDSQGYNYKYSDLLQVIETAKPALEKSKLSIVQLVGDLDASNNIGLTTLLLHESGQWFKSHASMPLVEMKGSNKAQEAGATISYMRRYAYQAIIGMASEDTDGVPSTNVKPVETKTESKKKTEPLKLVGKEINPERAELEFWKTYIGKSKEPDALKSTLCQLYYMDCKKKLNLDEDVALALAGSYVGLEKPESLKDVFSSAKNLTSVCMKMKDAHDLDLFKKIRGV